MMLSKPTIRAALRRIGTGACLLGLGMGMAALPSPAPAAGSVEVDLAAPAAAGAVAPARRGYVLRCWQYGRLILEEIDVSPVAGADGAQPKLKLLDAGGMPMYLSETKNATCILRDRHGDPAAAPPQ